MTRHNHIILRTLFILTISANSTTAQTDNNNSFDQYRKEILNNFKTFRQDVLRDYHKYLDGIWREYDSFRGLTRDPYPKYSVAPQIKTPIGKPTDIPTPNDINKQPTSKTPDKQLFNQTPTALSSTPSQHTITVNFYGMLWKAPNIRLPQIKSSTSESLGNTWKHLQQANIDKIIPQLKAITNAHGLNDWFCFQFVKDYVYTVAKNNDNHTKTIILHFLLLNWGYDLRLAYIGKELCLLIPFRQQVYNRSFITINNQKYYIFIPDNKIIDTEQRVSTYLIPDNTECGNIMDLTFHQPIKTDCTNAKTKTISDGKITVTADIDTTLMELIRHYPQMEITAYIQSILMPDMHHQLISQIKSQLSGLQQQDAANKLLYFMQHAFKYATDKEQHGYEKPYFLEENFYYPRNDCEDRAILYAYLMHNIFDLDVHLVHFPGHECTAIHFADNSIQGDGYIYNGKKYIICDPTYIGATIGMCMEDYKHTQPKVELWY